MIKILDKRKAVDFIYAADLAEGTMFEWNGDVFIRCKDLKSTDPEAEIVAFNLSGGEHLYFHQLTTYQLIISGTQLIYTAP